MKNGIIVFVLFFIAISCGKNKSGEIKIEKYPEKKKEVNVEDSRLGLSEITEEKVSISTKEARDHINKTAIVEGYIADVVKRPKVNYLNFDKKYPDNSFTVVVFPDDSEKFGDLYRYKNKNVKVHGKINLYKGKPQIIANSPNQIEILK